MKLNLIFGFWFCGCQESIAVNLMSPWQTLHNHILKPYWAILHKSIVQFVWAWAPPLVDFRICYSELQFGCWMDWHSFSIFWHYLINLLLVILITCWVNQYFGFLDMTLHDRLSAVSKTCNNIWTAAESNFMCCKFLRDGSK